MTKFNQKYLLSTITLSLVLVMAIVPIGNTPESDVTFYGAAEIQMLDIEGNEKFSQTIHNRLVDTGEAFLLQAAFQDTNSIADDVSIGSICVSLQPTGGVTTAITEVYTATQFDANDALTTNNCEEDTTVTISGGTAVIGPLSFEAATGDINVPAGQITNIGVCQNQSGSDVDFNGCATAGILFAVVDTSDVILASGESVNVTYTFDISSSTT